MVIYATWVSSKGMADFDLLQIFKNLKVTITLCNIFNFYVYLCENSVFFKYRRVIFNFKTHMKNLNSYF